MKLFIDKAQAGRATRPRVLFLARDRPSPIMEMHRGLCAPLQRICDDRLQLQELQYNGGSALPTA